MAKWVYVEAAQRNLGSLRSALEKDRLAVCISKSINQCLRDGVKEAREAVRATYNIPSKYLTDIKAIPANRGGYRGEILASKKPLPLELFKPKFPNQTSSKKAAVKKKTIKKSGKKKSKYYTGIPAREGGSVEIRKGRRVNIPYAFMLPTSPKVFARGKYKTGGAYGFKKKYKQRDQEAEYKTITPLITITLNRAAMLYKPNRERINRVTRAGMKQYLLEEVLKEINKLPRE